MEGLSARPTTRPDHPLVLHTYTQGLHGVTKLNIHKLHGQADKLPVSHTCVGCLDDALPCVNVDVSNDIGFASALMRAFPP